MSDKGFTEAITEWGEREFKCTYCPSVYWFILDIEDHVNRHKRNNPDTPAQDVYDEAAKWRTLGEQYEATATSIREMQATVTRILDATRQTTGRNLEAARQTAWNEGRRTGYTEGHAEGVKAGRDQSYAQARIESMVDARKEARFETLHELAEFLADSGHFDAASQVRGTFLEGN